MFIIFFFLFFVPKPVELIKPPAALCLPLPLLPPVLPLIPSVTLSDCPPAFSINSFSYPAALTHLCSVRESNATFAPPVLLFLPAAPLAQPSEELSHVPSTSGSARQETMTGSC